MSKIVIADDNPVSRELIREVLAKPDYKLIEAYDGRQALKIIEETNPDLVLLDIQMPQVDGYGVLERLRSDPRFASVRVIALTALAMREDRERTREPGFDSYVNKPIKASILRAEVERVLQSRANEDGSGRARSGGAA